MNLNDILILTRDSLLAVSNIKNAVSGHVYSAWINNSSILPCITMFLMRGTSPSNINGACEAIVQLRIWTDNNSNPNDVLYGIYEDIIDNFHQKHKENDVLKMSTSLGKPDSQHPAIMQEQYKNNIIYSLPVLLTCKAIYL